MPSLLSPDALDRLEALARSSPPGALVEVGVYQGGSAERLYRVATEQKRALYLYDTFTGHPGPIVAPDDAAFHWPGRFHDAADPEELRCRLPGAFVVVGCFPESLRPMPPVAFVHADADLYAVTRAVCDHLYPLLVPGGGILFDDYDQDGCAGCTAAVDERFGRQRVPGARYVRKG